MTQAQQKLVEDNTQLVYRVIRDLHCTVNEDIVQESMLYLCKAAISYDATKGSKFSTWAYNMIRLGLLNYIWKSSKFNTHEIKIDFSADADVDIVVSTSHTDTQNDVFTKLMLDSIILKVDDETKCIIRMQLEGLNQREISTKLGITPSRVNQKLANIRYTINIKE